MQEIKLVNFRDMGGLTTPYGAIKKGKIYRTAAFVPKNKADEDFIRNMNLDAVVDFRTEAERTEKPDVLPSGVALIYAPVFDEGKLSSIAPTKEGAKAILSMTDEQLDRLRGEVRDSYKDLPFSSKYDEVFALMDENKTIAFHCTAGKDRTGMCACLIELAFGRSFEDCRKEYLASNLHREKENAKVSKLLKIMGVRKSVRDFTLEMLQTHDYLFDIAQEAILSKYDTAEEFLEKAHGVTKERIDAWREYYIER